MARWADIERDEPEFAARAKGRFDAHTHKTLATIRPDGSPRVSGTECLFTDGDLWLGSMWQATKARDLQRDPRFALHSGSDDPTNDWKGDAKLSGRALEVTDEETKKKIVTSGPPGPFHLFRADIRQVVIVWVEDMKHMVVESWREGRGVRVTKRT